jgi:hypothetical protein
MATPPIPKSITALASQLDDLLNVTLVHILVERYALPTPCGYDHLKVIECEHPSCILLKGAIGRLSTPLLHNLIRDLNHHNQLHDRWWAHPENPFNYRRTCAYGLPSPYMETLGGVLSDIRHDLWIWNRYALRELERRWISEPLAHSHKFRDRMGFSDQRTTLPLPISAIREHLTRSPFPIDK